MSLFNQSDNELNGRSFDKSVADMNASALSMNDNDLVGMNANAVDDIQALLNDYRDKIYQKAITLNDQKNNMFGDNINEKFKSYIVKVVDACVDFLNSFEPFNNKLEFVKNAYETAKKTHKNQVGGYMSATGLMVQDGVIDGTKVVGTNTGVGRYKNPNETIRILSKEAIPESGMTVDEIIDYWAREGRTGNGDERKKKCEELGLDYYDIQDKINERYGYGPTTKPDGYNPSKYKTQEEYDAEVRKQSNIGNYVGNSEAEAFERERIRRENEQASKGTNGSGNGTTTTGKGTNSIGTGSGNSTSNNSIPDLFVTTHSGVASAPVRTLNVDAFNYKNEISSSTAPELTEKIANSVNGPIYNNQLITVSNGSGSTNYIAKKVGTDTRFYPQITDASQVPVKKEVSTDLYITTHSGVASAPVRTLNVDAFNYNNEISSSTAPTLTQTITNSVDGPIHNNQLITVSNSSGSTNYIAKIVGTDTRFYPQITTKS